MLRTLLLFMSVPAAEAPSQTPHTPEVPHSRAHARVTISKCPNQLNTSNILPILFPPLALRPTKQLFCSSFQRLTAQKHNAIIRHLTRNSNIKKMVLR